MKLEWKYVNIKTDKLRLTSSYIEYHFIYYHLSINTILL